MKIIAYWELKSESQTAVTAYFKSLNEPDLLNDYQEFNYIEDDECVIWVDLKTCFFKDVDSNKENDL